MEGRSAGFELDVMVWVGSVSVRHEWRESEATRIINQPDSRRDIGQS